MILHSSAESLQPEPVLVARVVWYRDYDGSTRGFDPGGFKAHIGGRNDPKAWHERFNFKPVGDQVLASCFHFTRGVGWNKISIENFGASKKDHWFDGITVVFVGRNPAIDENVVIGALRGARVYREMQKSRQREYYFKGSTSQLLVVPPDLRTYIVPSRPGPGQSAIYFASRDPKLSADRALGSALLRYLDELLFTPDARSGRGRGRADPAVEQAAMEAVLAKLERGWKGWRIYPGKREQADVSKLNKGWDIEVKGPRGAPRLLVEVKGLSANDVNFELTRNEYAMACMHAGGKYGGKLVLAVVTGVIEELTQCLRFFEFDDAKAAWSCDDGMRLKSEPSAVRFTAAET